MSDTPIPAEVYNFGGGCTSCGGGLWTWLQKHGVQPELKNVQITNLREEAYARAEELKPGEQHFFPMIFIGDTVVFGFQPDILQTEIDNLKEAA